MPGKAQSLFANKLGFKQERIFTSFYSADTNYYQSFQVQENKPKRFIYVGRYYDFKGIEDLWKAFIELQNEAPNEWELWCLGTGSIQPIEHSKIKHFGFVQPGDMAKFITETSVFILPSHFEPWGVVVHEFAAAGFPLICSSEVGAAEIFFGRRKKWFLLSIREHTRIERVHEKSCFDEQRRIVSDE